MLRAGLSYYRWVAYDQRPAILPFAQRFCLSPSTQMGTTRYRMLDRYRSDGWCLCWCGAALSPSHLCFIVWFCFEGRSDAICPPIHLHPLPLTLRARPTGAVSPCLRLPCFLASFPLRSPPQAFLFALCQAGVKGNIAKLVGVGQPKVRGGVMTVGGVVTVSPATSKYSVDRDQQPS